MFGIGRKSKGRKIVSANARKSGAADEMKRVGYRFDTAIPIGQDPGTGAVHSVVVGRRESDGMYATWLAVDWTLSEPGRGTALNHGHYNISSRDSAVADAVERAASDLADGYWVIPGTGQPVVPDGRMKYLKQTRYGHRIVGMYECAVGGEPSYCVAASAPGTPGYTWGIGYNIETGIWQDARSGQSVRQIREASKGMDIVFEDSELDEDRSANLKPVTSRRRRRWSRGQYSARTGGSGPRWPCPPPCSRSSPGFWLEERGCSDGIGIPSRSNPPDAVGPSRSGASDKRIVKHFRIHSAFDFLILDRLRGMERR